MTRRPDVMILDLGLRAARRRDQSGGAPPAEVAVIGRWAIDLAAHVVKRSDFSGTDHADSPSPGGLRLTPTEWRIRSAGVLRAAAVRRLGTRIGERTNYLRFHMARLRPKLEDDPARPTNLLTEPGMGYRYQP